MERNKIFNGDCLAVLKTFPDNSIDCCVTSPPYYALRDYGTGTWEGGNPNCPHYRTSKKSDKTATGHKRMQDAGSPVGDAIYKDVCPLCGAVRVDKQIGLEETPEKYIEKMTEVFMEVYRVLKPEGTLWVNIGDSYVIKAEGKYKQKDLIGIPWMLAFSLRNAGWYLRQDIIWHKPNPMPESVKDRCTKSHEYIFLFSKSQKYYFNHEELREPCVDKSNDNIRNKRDVWSINVKPCKEAHFATYPFELVKPCILAGCPEGGAVLDPFMGSGTTAIVANRLDRDFVGIELNPEYIKIAEKRLTERLGLFL